MSCAKPCKVLAVNRPPQRLLRPESICMLVVQMIIISSFQVAALRITKLAPGHTEFDPYASGNVMLEAQQVGNPPTPPPHPPSLLPACMHRRQGEKHAYQHQGCGRSNTNIANSKNRPCPPEVNCR